jgi:predicted MFS family arabinose efflux permease
VGGYLASVSYRNGFYAGAALAVLGLGASLAYAPSRAIEPSHGFWRDFLGSYARLVRIFATRRLVLLGAALVFLQCFLTFVMGGSFLLIYAREIGLSAFVASALLSGRDGVSSLVRLSYGAVSRRISPLVLIAVGVASGALILAFLPLAESAAGVALITLSLGAVVAFMPPAVNMLSGASAAPGEQSFAIAALSVANYAAQTVLSPLLGVALARWGYGRAYPLMGAVWVVLALVTLCVGQKVMRAHRAAAPLPAPGE